MSRLKRLIDEIDADRIAIEFILKQLREMSDGGLQDDLVSAEFLFNLDRTIDTMLAASHTYAEVLAYLDDLVDGAMTSNSGDEDLDEALGFVGTLLDAGRAQAVRS